MAAALPASALTLFHTSRIATRRPRPLLPTPPPAVRALQLGLSSVPRVDPRVPRSLEDYCGVYREWLLLLRGRLQQQVRPRSARPAGALGPASTPARDHPGCMLVAAGALGPCPCPWPSKALNV
jgi:hypothetical protein